MQAFKAILSPHVKGCMEPRCARQLCAVSHNAPPTACQASELPSGRCAITMRTLAQADLCPCCLCEGHAYTPSCSIKAGKDLASWAVLAGHLPSASCRAWHWQTFSAAQHAAKSTSDFQRPSNALACGHHLDCCGPALQVSLLWKLRQPCSTFQQTLACQTPLSA